MSTARRIQILLRGGIGFSGMFVASVAISILWAWQTNNYSWVQAGNSAWVPVQYNTALAFTVTGIAVFAMVFGQYRVGLIGAGSALTFGSLTLVEYLFRCNLGIDQIFFHSDLIVQTSHPGRMAPNTALAFVLSGGALALRCALFSSERRLRWVGAFGFVTMLFGVITLWGYASGIERAYGWGEVTRMSPITAVLFIFLGGGVIGFALQEAIQLRARLLEAVPVYAVATLVFGTLMLWSALKEHQKLRRQESAEAAKYRFTHEFTQQVELAGAAIRRMSHRWEKRGGGSLVELRSEAEEALREGRIFQAIECLDSESKVRWAVSAVGNEVDSNKISVNEPIQQWAMNQAKLNHELYRSATFELPQGERGFLLIAPLEFRGRFDGYLIGVVRLSILMDDILEFMEAGFAVELKESGVPIFEGLAPGGDGKFEATGVVDLYGIPMDVRVRPVREFRESIDDYLPEIAFIAGMMGSVLVGLLAFLFLRSHRHASQLQEVNRRFELEIADRRRAEEVGEQRNRDLETLLYVISHDLREPLRGIESFSRLVYERYVERLDEKGQDFLRRIVFASMRLDRLLDDIFMLSRVQRMDKPSETIEARELVMEALSRLETKTRVSEAKITVERDLPLLHVSRVWGTQAIFNLLANALKFTREGVPPEIEVGGYRDEEKRQMGLVVHDRGVGVKAEHRERIFKLFQRAVGREVEGNGAGLAIVRQIAERHGGLAWCEPRHGGGSSFFVTFGWGMEKLAKPEKEDETSEDTYR